MPRDAAFARVCLLALSSLVVACHSSHGPQTRDSNTNWLHACVSDGQCEGAALCLCGVCTRACGQASDCREVADDAQCVSTSNELLGERCDTWGHHGADAICFPSFDDGPLMDAALPATDATVDAALEVERDADVDAMTTMDAEIGATVDAIDASIVEIEALDGALTSDAADPDGSTVAPGCDGCQNGGRAECSGGRVSCACPIGTSGGRCETVLPIRQLVAGAHHSCVLLGDNRVKCWGRNDKGQLGIGDTEARGDEPDETASSLGFVDFGTDVVVERIAAGGAHTCAAFVDDSMRCWGDNTFGQLGLGDTETRGDQADEIGAMFPVLPLGPVPLEGLSLGEDHTCIVALRGNVSCWGGNQHGQLGVGDRVPRGDDLSQGFGTGLTVLLGTAGAASQVAAGNGFSCALLGQDRVKCWGDNSAGQLGQGDTAARGGNDPLELADALAPIRLGDTSSSVFALVAGGRTVCAHMGDSVRCWGNNDRGQALLGTTDARGDDPSELGRELLAAQLPTRAVRLAAGGDHLCAWLESGVLKCWGDNGAGQLGLGDTEARGDEPTELGANLPSVALPAGQVTQLALGARHTCVVIDDASVYCWGENGSGELGLGSTARFGDEAGELPATLQSLSF